MEIHEYQIKSLFRQHGIPVPKGGIAYTPEEAFETAKSLKCDCFMIKAQVFCHNRSAGHFAEEPTSPDSGIILVKTLQEIPDTADRMLGKHLIMPESPEIAHHIQKIYIEEYCSFSHFFKLSFFIERLTQGIVCAVQTEQGKIVQFDIPDQKISATLIQHIIKLVKLPKEQKKALKTFIRKLYQFFSEQDALALETKIVLRDTGELTVLTGRIIFDSDSLFKFPETADLVEVKPGLERESEAHLNNFRYIRLNGNIACLVNGAGLGLATIDAVHDGGGRVACLLDVGTEPSKEAVSKAFKLALSEPDIDGILVNIFGGITRCDVIAQGLISASKEISVGLPIIVRMDGTNVKIGTRLLFESHLPFIVIQDMAEAVSTVIKKTREIS